MGTVVVDGHIYVCGGYDGKSSLNSVECYSPETDRWVLIYFYFVIIHILLAQTHHILINQNVMGYSYKFLFIVFCFPSHRWMVVTEMNASRSAAGVTVFDGRIFVSGGHDGLQIFNTVSVGSTSQSGLAGLTHLSKE